MNQSNSTSTSRSEPKWGPNGQLEITGELKIVSTDLVINSVIVGTTVLAQDDLGTVWDVSGRNFASDLRPKVWPTGVHAMYWLHAHKPGNHARGIASSFEEAVAKYRSHYTWLSNEIVVLEKITSPHLDYHNHRNHYVWT